MDNRRKKRKEKKRKAKRQQEEIRCIVFLSSDENDSFDLAEKKEDKQYRYIEEYADAHGLIPMKIVRRSCMGAMVTNQIFMRCISLMKAGKAEALLVANMKYITNSERDIYNKVGIVRENGFRVFTVDDGELKLELKNIRK